MSYFKNSPYLAGKNGEPVLPKLDAATSSIQTIDYAHHERHAGSAFFISDVVDLSINNVYDLQITTPNTTKWAHFTFWYNNESETELYLYENVTIANAGTGITPLNSDRNSATASTVVVKGISNASVADANTDTATVGATVLLDIITGAGSRHTGEAEHANEFILKQNEDYSLRFIANAAGYISFHLDWYEHTNNA
jgi:hypothetical protein